MTNYSYYLLAHHDLEYLNEDMELHDHHVHEYFYLIFRKFLVFNFFSKDLIVYREYYEAQAMVYDYNDLNKTLNSIYPLVDPYQHY